jgi:hypothetical protein
VKGCRPWERGPPARPLGARASGPPLGTRASGPPLGSAAVLGRTWDREPPARPWDREPLARPWERAPRPALEPARTSFSTSLPFTDSPPLGTLTVFRSRLPVACVTDRCVPVNGCCFLRHSYKGTSVPVNGWWSFRSDELVPWNVRWDEEQWLAATAMMPLIRILGRAVYDD